jgi:hypothetical protein
MKQFNEMQLRFDLEMSDVEDDATERAISFEEARLISEAARVHFIEEFASQAPSQSSGLRLAKTQGKEWWGDYLKLIEQGWPWRVACYIAWASSPKIGRWPGTLKELSTEILGLTGPRTVYTWRQKFPTIDTVVAMMQAAPLWEHRRDIFEALIKVATTPDYKGFNDRKMALEMLSDYIPKSKLELGKSAKPDEEELSDEELRAILGEGGLKDKDQPKGYSPEDLIAFFKRTKKKGGLKDKDQPKGYSSEEIRAIAEDWSPDLLMAEGWSPEDLMAEGWSPEDLIAFFKRTKKKGGLKDKDQPEGWSPEGTSDNPLAMTTDEEDDPYA